jgi:tRNA pseudouridine55 synthase
MEGINKNFDFQKGEILIFNKPLEWTSFQLVKKIRNQLCRFLNIKKLKVGHAGTLDPMATGLMVICTGKATKKIEELQAGVKEYIATLKLGATTPSFDLEKEEDKQYETKHIDKNLVSETLSNFIGTIEQVPPMFSAVRVNGKRAYELARKGEDAKLKAKKLVIDSIEIIDFSMPELKLKIVCSKGTYIRALARDIGEALNSGAYLTALQRTRVGDYYLSDAYEIDDFVEKLK